MSTELYEKLFGDLKRELSSIDPVSFAESNLLIDGRPFNMTGTGWKFMADIYRDVAAQTGPNGKPIVILKGRQVGATVMAAVLSLYFTSSGLYGASHHKPPIRVLHAFPTLGIMAKYVKDKLSVLIQSSRDNFISKRFLRNDKVAGKEAPEDTLTEKTFIGFNKLRVDSLGKDSDRLRGLSQDVFLADECQDMSQAAIENALRILTSAQYGPATQGVQVYFGTPKQPGSYFWDLWQASNQQYYQLKCVNCGHGFFLYTLGSNEWRDILTHGHNIRCPACKFDQNKKDAIDGGKWIATKEGPCKYIGYHMNVLLNPVYTKEAILDYDPEVNPTRSYRAWHTETLGNFYNTSSMTLSMEDIKLMCLNEERGLAKSIKENSDKVYVMGIDWGDKVEAANESGDDRGQSYTVIVILSVDKTGTYTIENAWRLPRNDLEYKLEVIQHLFTRFRIKNCVADYMWGSTEVNYIQNTLQYNDRFLGAINSGSAGSVLTYKPKELRVVINKDLMLDEMFSLLKKGKVKFPAKADAYERIYWLMQHCTSMEIEPAQRNGSPIKRYKKGLGPNDGLMALMYAVVAYKFIATNGFKMAAGSRAASGRPMPRLAFAPSV